MSLKKEKKTLYNKIAESFAPQKFIDTESEDETTAPKLAEVDENDFEYNNELSSFRKQNVKLLSDVSAKYRGKISSRNEFQDSEDDSDEEQRRPEEQSSGNDGSDLEKYNKKLKEKCRVESSEEYSEDDSEAMDEDADEEEEISEEEDSFCDSSGSAEEKDDEGDEDVVRNENEDQTTILRESNQSIQKGFAVQNQLRMWENMLQIRMVSHKMLIKANSLPGPANFNELCDDSTELSTLAQETKRNVEGLLYKMVKIQELLLERFSETTDLLKQSKKHKLETAANDEEPAVKRFANVLQTRYETYQPYCNSVIQKWYDRTKVLTPGSSSKRGSDFDILQKIEAVLLNKSDLIKKSQTVKGNYKLFGRTAHDEVDVGGDNDEGNNGFENTQNNKNDVSCPEIYDDLDFYDQQVRELIEFKTNTSNATETIKKFAVLQQIRQKMKKKVDTRASKGRKIRYLVYKPVVNFVASDPHSNWNDEAEDELLSNFFKKIV